MNYCWIIVVAFALAGLRSVELRPRETIEDQKFLEYLLDLEKRLLEESGLSDGNDEDSLGESEDELHGSPKSMFDALIEQSKRVPELIANRKRVEAHMLLDGIVSAILDDENSIMKIKEQLKRMLFMITKLYNDLASAEASETTEATNAIIELMKEIGEGDEKEEEDAAYKRNKANDVILAEEEVPNESVTVILEITIPAEEEMLTETNIIVKVSNTNGETVIRDEEGEDFDEDDEVDDNLLENSTGC